VIYRAMGFPTKFFTVLFALGRLPGWIAHWREMMADPQTKIGRPRQLYVGSTERDYKAISERG
jgi:citrate synthase